MTICTGNVDLFHISNHLVLFPLAHLTGLAVHEGSPELVRAALAYFGPERDLVGSGLLLGTEALDNDFEILGVVVLAEFPVFDILFQLFGADQTVFLMFEGVLDDVGAFVADFATLRDAVRQVLVVEAGQFDLIGETFVEIMPAQRRVLRFMPLHIHF